MSTSMSGRRRPALLAMSCLLAVPAGCDSGSADEGSPDTTGATQPVDTSPADSTVTVTGGDLFFRPKELTVAPGRIRLELVNDGGQFHTLLADGVAKFKLSADAGETVGRNVALEPGEYLLYCDVPGHQAAGMEATLTVR